MGEKWRDRESQTDRKSDSVQNERYRQPEIERNASRRVQNVFSIPPVEKDDN